MKKIISFLIAAVMIVSMIPFASAAGTEYHFDFTPASHTVGETAVKNFTIETTKEGYDKWGFVFGPTVADGTCWGNGINWSFKLANGMEYNPDKGLLPPSLTIEIQIDDAGIYQTEILKDLLNESNMIHPFVEAYLIKKPADPDAWIENYEENLLNLSTSDRFAIHNTNRYGAGTYGDYYLNSSTVEITEPGRYYLIFIPNGARKSDLDKLATTQITYAYFRPKGLKLTKIDTQDAAKAAILNENGGTVAPTAAGTAQTSVTVKKMVAVLGGEPSVTLEDVTLDSKGYATVTADAKDGAGNSFLYWVKGLSNGAGKKIILPQKNSDNLYSATFKPETGMNYIIAVYGNPESTEEKYYNANGQLLPDSTTPTMPGYTFKEWVDCGNGMKVADYTEDDTTYTVTVKQSRSKSTVTEAALQTITGKKYGDLVTVTAPARFDDTTNTDPNKHDYYDYEAFNYWEKDGEIVSFDRNYSFYAYEDCTLTAVYNVYEPISKSLRKIILTNTGANNIMAEFIGLSDAVEKGIIFGGTSLGNAGIVKSAMTTGSSQYVVENDKNYTSYTGYAILTDGSVIYDK